MKVSGKNSNKQKNSRDISTDDEVEDISNEIQKMFASFRFIELLEKTRQDNLRMNDWFAYNFIINIPTLEELENQKSDLYSSKLTQQTNEHLKENISSFDIIRSKDEVTITLEMPDIKEKDIEFRVTKDTIEIIPDHPEGKYHKIINLPCDVKPRTLTFTYRNGILDIIIQRGEKEGWSRLKKNKVEQKIKECIGGSKRKKVSFSKLDEIEMQDLCDEYWVVG